MKVTPRSLSSLALVLMVSDLSIAQWTLMNGPGGQYYVSAIAQNATSLIASTVGDGVFQSTNNGTDWTPINTGLAGQFIYAFRALAVGGSGLYVGTSKGVYRSTDNGASWAPANSGLTYTEVSSIKATSPASGGEVLTAGTYNGIFTSTNGGTSWVESSDGAANKNIWTLAGDGTKLYAGTNFRSTYRSTNYGVSWVRADSGLPQQGIRSIAVMGTSVFAGTDGGVFGSTNNGVSWNERNNGLTPTSVTALVNAGTDLFAAVFGRGVFISKDSGASWIDVNEGLVDSNVWSLTVIGNELFLGTDSGRIWRRPLAEMPVSVERIAPHLPQDLQLFQNYPNPFNPTTSISFMLSMKLSVTLKIYNSIGMEIATLVNEELSPGLRTVRWTPYHLPSGVYFCRLETNALVVTRKLLLIR